jgi:dipeptidyl aminopeptidase/acylaminoacyl peptidase
MGEGDDRRVQWLSSEGLTPGLSLPANAGSVFAASASRRAVIARRVEPDARETLRRLGGSAEEVLAQINRDYGSVESPRVVPIAHKGPDGQPLTSWLFLPPAPAVPPPLIVRPYPGAAYAKAPNDPPSIFGFMTSVRMMVGHGYAVLVPSLPSAAGRTDPMPGLAGRILEIVDAAAQAPSTSGAFDSGRLALWGHSYGGYAVMAAITQTDRFRAAVSLSGLSDLESKWGTMQTPYRVAPEEGMMMNWSAGSTESGQDEMRRPPWEDPERYRRNSPLMAADRIHTPLLLIHGEQDPIPLAQSETMFAALYRQNKDAILATYWGESHAILSPGNVRDMYARAFAFLDEHFKRPERDAAAAPGASPAGGLASDAPTPPAPRPRAGR